MFDLGLERYLAGTLGRKLYTTELGDRISKM